jgi:hypothetical protein
MRFTAKIYEMTLREVTFETALASADRGPNGAAIVLDFLMDHTKYHTVSIEKAAPDARLSTFTCYFCGKASLKEQWGPGRITCPKCQGRALEVSFLSQP